MSKIIISKKNCRFTKKFLKNLQKVSPYSRKRIEKKLSEILENKRPSNIKKLSNYPIADYRLRIDEFRLFFSFSDHDNIILFIDCISRKNLY